MALQVIYQLLTPEVLFLSFSLGILNFLIKEFF